MTTNLDALGKLIHYSGRLLCAARAIQLDCEIMQREPTPEEQEVLIDAAFMTGCGMRPMGTISQLNLQVDEDN